MSAAKLRLTLLCEDTAADPGLSPGHGLCVLVEFADQHLLFDAGPGEQVLANAGRLGLNLSDLRTLVLSHGHYDHVGGLSSLVGASLEPLTVIAHPALFDPAYALNADGSLRHIGPPHSRSEYEDQGVRFTWAREPLEIGPGVWTSGEIERHESLATGPAALLRSGPAGLFREQGHDELALLLHADGGLILLTGCAHAGVANLVRQAQRLHPGCGVRAVVGGFHLGGAAQVQVQDLAGFLEEAGVGELHPCHCTGDLACEVLSEHFPGRVSRPGTGTVLEY